MLGNRSIGIRTLSAFWLVVLVSLSFWGWLFIWENSTFSDRDLLERYLLYNEFLLVGILFGLGGNRNRQASCHEFVDAARRSGRQALLGLFSVFVIVFALRDTLPSRTFFFSYIPLLYLTLLFSNYMVPRWQGKWSFARDRKERVALAGTLEQAGQFKPWLERKNVLGLSTVGVICPNRPNGRNGHGPETPFPVLGDVQQIHEILCRESITQLIVLDLSLGAAQLRTLTQICESSAVRMFALHNLNSYFNHATTTFEDDGVRFICLRDEPLESPTNRLVKRAMDLAIALPAVIFILPFTTIAVWLLQRLQSPGPVLFRQSRVGMMGRPFTILKYRTMHARHDGDIRQASADDSRIYAVGRWLRKLSIDELPQFINVLRGDMSIVGPRPHLEKHDELWRQVMRSYTIRRFIRPGLTGWAQVQGFRGEIRAEKDIRRRVEADIHYLENWSPSLDLLIILKTFKQCLAPPSSAY